MLAIQLQVEMPQKFGQHEPDLSLGQQLSDAIARPQTEWFQDVIIGRSRRFVAILSEPPLRAELFGRTEKARRPSHVPGKGWGKGLANVPFGRDRVPTGSDVTLSGTMTITSRPSICIPLTLPRCQYKPSCSITTEAKPADVRCHRKQSSEKKLKSNDTYSNAVTEPTRAVQLVCCIVSRYCKGDSP